MDWTFLVTVVGVIVTGAAAVPAYRAWFANSTPESDPAARAPSLAAQPSMLRCGVHEFAPFGEIEADNPSAAHGPMVSLVREVFKRMGIEIKFVHFSFDDLYTEGNDIPDIALGMFETPRRCKRLCFSRALYEVGLQGICRRDLQGDLLDQMREGQLKVAVYYGEIGWEFVLDELPDAKHDQKIAVVGGGVKQRDTITLLEAGKYDVVLTDEVTCMNFLNEGDNAQNFKLAFRAPLSMYRLAISLRSDHKHLLEDVNKLAKTIRNSDNFLRMEAEAIAPYEAAIQRRALQPRRWRA